MAITRLLLAATVLILPHVQSALLDARGVIAGMSARNALKGSICERLGMAENIVYVLVLIHIACPENCKKCRKKGNKLKCEKCFDKYYKSEEVCERTISWN